MHCTDQLCGQRCLFAGPYWGSDINYSSTCSLCSCANKQSSEGWEAVNCDKLLVLPYTANLFIPQLGWKYGNASCQILTSHVQNEGLSMKAVAAAARDKTDFGWDWCAAKSPLKYSGIAWCWITKRMARHTKPDLSLLKKIEHEHLLDIKLIWTP